MSTDDKLGFFVSCAALSAIVVFAYAAPHANAIGAVWKSCCVSGCDYGPSCVLVSGWYCCAAGWSSTACPECIGCAKQTQSCSVLMPCCGAYSADSTCYYSGKCLGSPATCTFSTCSLLDQCSGTNRCGSASGDIRNYSGACGSGGCTFLTENCGCGALDSDGGQIFTTRGTCTDYTGCSGAACLHVNYTDSCVNINTLREYYVTGTGDAAACSYVDKDCTTLGEYYCGTGRCIPEGTPTTTTTLPAECNLASAAVTANCGGGASADCEAGESVFMSGTYSGTCSAANFLQMDARSADGLCDIQYTGGDMSGVWDSSITVSGGIVTNAAWTIPAVAADCVNKTVSAQAAALWNGLPGTGTWIDGAETVSGAFKFAGAAATTTTTTLPGTSFTIAIKPGWNLISVPYRIISGTEQDDCGATNGNFYFYDAATGKWNVKTVGITNLRKATSYWFYSTKYCSIVVRGYDDVVAADVVLAKNEWSDVGAPKGGMSMQSLADAMCPSCAGSRCSSMKVLYYDTLAGQFKEATTLEEGRGYRVQCVGS